MRGIGLDLGYLSKREQFVLVNGYNSKHFNVACGVPQGYVLSPLFFLICINDMPNTSSKFAFYLLADDTNIYFELKSLKKWLDANKLTLNVEKPTLSFFIYHNDPSMRILR